MQKNYLFMDVKGLLNCLSVSANNERTDQAASLFVFLVTSVQNSKTFNSLPSFMTILFAILSAYVLKLPILQTICT